MKTATRHAAQKRRPHRYSLTRLFKQHRAAAFASWHKLTHAPLSSGLTVLVIAIALALPATLFVILNNAASLTGGLKDSSTLSLFLKQSVTPSQLQQFETTLKLKPEIAKIHYISPQDGLKALQAQGDFSDALDALSKNPLPGVIEVTPGIGVRTPYDLTLLVSTLKQYPTVKFVQFDQQWIARLTAIVNFVERGTSMLFGLLALAVLLIMGNTIRLATQQQRKEISVYQLLGASQTYIRRPFLYTGLWYGVLAGVGASIIVSVFWWLVSAPLQKLLNLYQSNYHLQGLSLSSSVLLIMLSMGLGFLGAWFAVMRELRYQ